MKAKLPKGQIVTINNINLTLSHDTDIEVKCDTVEQLAETLAVVGVLSFNDNLSTTENIDGRDVRVFYGAKGKRVVEDIVAEDVAPVAARNVIVNNVIRER